MKIGTILRPGNKSRHGAAGYLLVIGEMNHPKLGRAVELVRLQEEPVAVVLPTSSLDDVHECGEVAEGFRRMPQFCHTATCSDKAPLSGRNGVLGRKRRGHS